MIKTAPIRHSSDKRYPPEPRSEAGDETWWRDEVGILVEHEVWHLPRLAEEQVQA